MIRTFICQECNIEFESTTKRKLKKFCSRSCYGKEDSRRKKEKFKNNPHHNLGRKASVSEKEMRSKKSIDTWKDINIRKSRTNGINNYIHTHKHGCGWDVTTRSKRDVNVKLNGHNFHGKFGTRECDITCIKKYGISSHELRNKRLRSIIKTKPEIKAESLLIQLDKNFIYEYKFKNRYFDFGLESEKVLIEIDGEYWHGKGIVYESMNEHQRATFRNDIYKNDLVNNSDWKLIRIWATDLETITLDELKEIIYGKNNKNKKD